VQPGFPDEPRVAAFGDLTNDGPNGFGRLLLRLEKGGERRPEVRCPGLGRGLACGHGQERSYHYNRDEHQSASSHLISPLETQDLFPHY
jgi:hypothetical protein